MAEMNQEIYSATGTTGNKTYYRRIGKAIAREVLTPMSPPTNAQTIRRRIVAQVGKDYLEPRCKVIVAECAKASKKCLLRAKKTLFNPILYPQKAELVECFIVQNCLKSLRFAAQALCFRHIGQSVIL